MATVSQEEKNEMSDEQQKKYCSWCFDKDYGNCKLCALNAVTMPCDKCGQVLVENGIGGEYPCSLCGIPTLHDDSAQQMREPDSLKAGDSCLPGIVKSEGNLPA